MYFSRYINIEESSGKWWLPTAENITDSAKDYDGDTEPLNTGDDSQVVNDDTEQSKINGGWYFLYAKYSYW